MLRRPPTHNEKKRRSGTKFLVFFYFFFLSLSLFLLLLGGGRMEKIELEKREKFLSLERRSRISKAKTSSRKKKEASCCCCCCCCCWCCCSFDMALKKALEIDTFSLSIDNSRKTALLSNFICLFFFGFFSRFIAGGTGYRSVLNRYSLAID